MSLIDVGRTTLYLLTGKEHPVYCQVCEEDITHDGGLRTVSDREELSDLVVCSGEGQAPTCFERLMGAAMNNGYTGLTLNFEYTSPNELQKKIEIGDLKEVHRSDSAVELQLQELLLSLHREVNVRYRNE